MLRYVLFDLSLFEKGSDQDEGRTDLNWLLEALTQRSQAYLKDHPDTPLLYQSGVVYEKPQQFNGDCHEAAVLRKALGSAAKDPKVADVLENVQAAMGGERFRDIGRILEKGSADCDNVSTWRAAELRQNGIKASPYITWKKRSDGGTTYHVLVRWPDNTLEDPSLLLGMGGPDRAADRAVELAKNAERVQMAKNAAAGVRRGSAAPSAQAEDDPFAALDAARSGTARRDVLDDVLGHGGGHHGGHVGNWPHGTSAEYPGDDAYDWMNDFNFDESFDERMLRHTGLMRGR